MKNAPLRNAQRWHTGGWHTYQDAIRYFRSIWKKALADGAAPGDSLGLHRDLLWLLWGHPEFAALMRDGLVYFTFRPDGRGNQRFVVVGSNTVEHPFSTQAALTGNVKPLRFPLNEDEPFGGLTP
jgi:hypothetical protein